MRLYYRPGTAAMAPHAALAEADADYELALVELDEHDQAPPEYLEVNPWGRVPTLVDDDLVLTESAAILLHIGERFPDTRLVPPVATTERSQLYRWLAYMTNTVQPTFLHWFYPERYTADPGGAAAVLDCAAATLRRHLDWLDGELATRAWLVGDERSCADLFLFMLTRWGRRQEPPAWDRPNLREHFLRTLELPGVARMIEEEALELPAWAA